MISLALVISLALPTYAALAVQTELEGEWQLVKSPIELNLFNGSDNGDMYCNAYAGSYITVKGAQCGGPLPISFSPQASTQVGCEANPEESRYLQSLETAQEYEVCDDVLTILGGSGELKFLRR
ncbi:META domain-containing protein [Okeania sp. SIO2B9]|uniref:META domain-containing protein n=1 Tax=Okeania sp. SIO2B9 TaxID=2607782 RepID=UPI0025800C23|nr:META domain-containing protein [Okeania sp. SIO2B9]